MQLTLYGDPRAFLEALGPALRPREVEEHLILGIAGALGPGDGSRLLAAVHDSAGLAIVALMQTGHPLLLGGERDDAAGAMDALLDGADLTPHAVRQVIAAPAPAEWFAAAWTRRAGFAPRLRMRQRQYALTAVSPVTGVRGSLRQAGSADLDRVAEWMAAFEAEALGPAGLARDVSRAGARDRAARRIAAGQIYLWVDVEARTMAGVARPTERGIAVNAVYTPPEWRGQGYATACVASLSELQLRAGREFCVLYTDVSNPTSNAIYTRVGYRPVRDLAMYEL